MSVSKAIDRERKFVLYGVLYLSNDPSSYNDENRQLIEQLETLIPHLEGDKPYYEKLKLWREREIFISHIWVGDTSRIVENDTEFGYKQGTPMPLPDFELSISPTTNGEILRYNLENLKETIERVCPFEAYKRDYLQHLELHRDSALFDWKLNEDIREAKKLVEPNWFNRSYSAGIIEWYESFNLKHDTINYSDYEILGLNKVLNQLPLFSQTSQSTPYFLNLLDRYDDIERAATGYFYHLLIPFLEETKKNFTEEQIARRESLKPTDHSGKAQPDKTGYKLGWKGNKSDLAELVWVLFKSERIIDSETGQPVTQKKLCSIIENETGVKLDIAGLMKGRMGTYKATSDGKTFMKTLFDLINERTSTV